MAEKKAILLVAGTVDVNGNGPAATKFKKKSVTLTNYTPGDVASLAAKVPGAVKAEAGELAAVFEGEAAFAYLTCGNLDAAGLENVLAKVMEVVDRRTLVVLAAADTLIFHGLGVNTKTGTVDRPARAQDVIPTLAHIADLPLPDDTTGAVLYQVLKETNLKLNEFLKLKGALTRMEAALQRDSREPWDKHDCA